MSLRQASGLCCQMATKKSDLREADIFLDDDGHPRFGVTHVTRICRHSLHWTVFLGISQGTEAQITLCFVCFCHIYNGIDGLKLAMVRLRAHYFGVT